MFAGGLSAQNWGQSNNGANNNFDNQFDDKLQELKKTKPNDSVRVIIQGIDPAFLSPQAAIFQAKFLKKWKNFHGFTMEMKARDLDKLAKWHLIISVDAPMKGHSTADGLEAPNSSSGALAAFQKYAEMYPDAGAGVGVAIVDSGVASHPDLPNVVKTVDFTGAPNVRSDPHGHGTHVAGIIGGSGQSSQGLYAGVAPSARLINLRVLDATGAGSTSNVISAIDWAIDNQNALGDDGKPLNIRVMNISAGHTPYESSATDPLAAACRRAVQAGIVVVVSAGNNGKDPLGNPAYGTITTPGIEPSVITVGAITTWGTPSRADDVVSTFSSRGPTIDHVMKPDLGAPGSRIVSASSSGSHLASMTNLQVGTLYLKLSGTSMAAPVVAGAAAMILSANPNLTPNLVKSILMYTAEKKGAALDLGAGEVNIAGAMDLATAVNPNAGPGQYWLTNPWVFARPYDMINSYFAVWGKTIVWSENRYGDQGSFMSYNRPLFAKTILWGDKSSWDQTILWDETILWSNTLTPGTVIVCDLPVFAETIIWDETILWDEL